MDDLGSLGVTGALLLRSAAVTPEPADAASWNSNNTDAPMPMP